MEQHDYHESTSVRYLNPIEGIQLDGRSYALFDPNFKINDFFTLNFQLQTFASNGLILWIGDPVPDSSFTIEIQNRQLTARAVVHGHPFSVRTNFTKNRLCDGIWHFIQIRLERNTLSMKVDKRLFTKTEARIDSIDMRGPLFFAGYSEKYSPPFLSVRANSFFHGNLRNLKLNDKSIEYLAPKQNLNGPEFYQFTTKMNSTKTDRSDSNSSAMTNRTFETTSTFSND